MILATTCPNICGVKLTCVLLECLHVQLPTARHVDHRCGNVGKLTRIAAAVADPEFVKEHPRKNSARFLVLGGYADFITSSAFVQGHGAITGLANIAPVGIQ